VKRALDIGETARINKNIDRALVSGARRIEGLCHRIFYPRLATNYFDWPNFQRAVPWRLWLDDTELISVSNLVSGGVTIPSTNYNLESNRVGPPYDRLEVNISTSSALSAGSTFQRSIAITGLWGYTDDSTTVGVTAQSMDTSQTIVQMDPASASETGVGSIIRIDDERMIVKDRTQVDTGQTLGGSGLTNAKSDVTVTVADGTQFAIDETIKIDSESMLISDITGNNLTVVRGFDGSVLATHAAATHIYAPRNFTVIRGAFGSTAASHLSGASVLRWEAPGAIMQLNITEAIHEVMQEQTGWFRTMSASSNFGGTSKRAASMEAIQDLRASVYSAYGRQARYRGI
jgi:uncharacterized Zn finger protein